MKLIAPFFIVALMSPSLYAASRLTEEQPDEQPELIRDFEAVDAEGRKNKRNSQQTFNEVVGSKKPVVIKFFLRQCGPCNSTKASYQAMAEKYKDKAIFLTLDVMKYSEFAEKFDIKRVPAFIIFANKKPLAIIRGSGKIKQIAEVLDKYLRKVR